MQTQVSTQLNQHLFDTICQLARAKDLEALNQLVTSSSVCIDLLHNGLTPVMLLAKEGDSSSVEFLINQFDCQINFALQGYAIAGNAEQVEHLIKKGASLKYAVEGYAIGGHEDKVNKLISRGASLNFAIQGYARGGHHEQVNNLLNRGASLKFAMSGYAIAGLSAEVENIFKGRSYLMRQAAAAYARGGHIDLVDNLILRGVELDYAIFGYATRGDREEVELLIAGDAELKKVAAMGYAIGGHVAHVEDLILHGVSLDDVVEGYARGGHVKQVNELLKRGARVEKALRGYARGGFAEGVDSLIAQGADINTAIKRYALGGHEDKVNELIARGGSLRRASFGYAVNGHLEMLLRAKAANKDSKLNNYIAGMIELAQVTNITVMEQALPPKKIAAPLPMACIITGFDRAPPISMLNQLERIGIVDIYVVLNHEEYLQAPNQRWQYLDDFNLMTGLEHYQSHSNNSQLKFHIIDAANAHTEEEKLQYYLNHLQKNYLMNLFVSQNSLPWVSEKLRSSLKLTVPDSVQLTFFPFISFDKRTLPSLEHSRSSEKAMELLERKENPCLCFQEDKNLDCYHYQWLFNIFVELVTHELKQLDSKQTPKQVSQMKQRMNELIQAFVQNITHLEKAEKDFNKIHAHYRGVKAKDTSLSRLATRRMNKRNKNRDFYAEKFPEIIIAMASIYQHLAKQRQEMNKVNGSVDSYTNMTTQAPPNTGKKRSTLREIKTKKAELKSASDLKKQTRKDKSFFSKDSNKNQLSKKSSYKQQNEEQDDLGYPKK